MIAAKFKLLKKSFLNKTPKQKWLFLFNFTNFTLKLSGQRSLADGKLNWRSYIYCVLAVVYYTLLPYSVIYHIANNNFVESLFPLCMFGVAVSVSISGQMCNTLLYGFRCFSSLFQYTS